MYLVLLCWLTGLKPSLVKPCQPREQLSTCVLDSLLCVSSACADGAPTLARQILTATRSQICRDLRVLLVD